MPPASSGMSRRALFGLGLTQLRERADERLAAASDAAAAVAPPPPPPTLASVLERWAAADAAGRAAAVWAPVASELHALAGVRDGETLAVFDPLAAGPPPAEGGADALVSLFGMQRTPAGFAALARMAAAVRPGGRLVFSVWSTGAVPRLLRTASDHDPLPPGCPPPSAWGRWERLRQDLDRHADEDDIAYHGHTVVLRAADGQALLGELRAAVPALGAAPAALGPALAEALAPYVAQDEGGGVRVEVACLLVRARLRP